MRSRPVHRSLPAVVLVSTAFGCGRADELHATGSEGGRCYGNGTCDVGLACDDGVCTDPSASPCAGVTCFDHGVCAVELDGPRCLCDSGFRAIGLSCVPCAGTSCDDSFSAMVLMADFPGGAFWIDAFEASFASGGLLGDADQDLDNDGGVADPLMAAAHASSHGLTLDTDGGEEGVTLTTKVAQSIPGVLPANGVSFYQVAAACANAGKRLCTPEEWLWACQEGAAATIFPYGDEFDGADEQWHDCWTSDMAAAPQLTGSASACTTPAGVFDMSGNAMEWTDYIDPTHGDLRGGTYYTTSTSMITCGGRWSSWNSRVPPDEAGPSYGFRCCLQQ